MFGDLGLGELTVTIMVILLLYGAWRMPPRVPPSAAAVVTPREGRKRQHPPTP